MLRPAELVCSDVEGEDVAEMARALGRLAASKKAAAAKKQQAVLQARAKPCTLDACMCDDASYAIDTFSGTNCATQSFSPLAAVTCHSCRSANLWLTHFSRKATAHAQGG